MNFQAANECLNLNVEYIRMRQYNVIVSFRFASLRFRLYEKVESLLGGFGVSAFHKWQETYSRYKRQRILHFARMGSRS